MFLTKNYDDDDDDDYVSLLLRLINFHANSLTI